MALTLHLVRHGQSEWNLARRVQGQSSDAPGLTELGRAQAAAAAAALAALGPADRVLTSDLVRARQTAEPIARALDLVPIPEPRLREQAMGSLEGMLSAAAFDWQPNDAWGPDSRLGGETGESSNEIRARLAGLLDELIGQAQLAGPARLGTAVLVSHGGAIRHAIGLLVATAPDRHLALDPDGSANGSITTAVVADGALTALSQVQSILS